MLKPLLTLAILTGMAATAQAGGCDRCAAPPPQAGYRYYGTVNNYYGPVTVYVTPGGGYAYYPSSPSYGASYGGGYATAPECDANCYGAGYNWSGSYAYGGGYAYPAYGNRYYYPPANAYQRQSPWAGYHGGWGNGYW